MAKDSENPTCFVIGPIGKEGSESRARADDTLENVFRPPAVDAGYEVQRADEIAGPGLITTQIIDRLFEADLVIADLAGFNPNVMYELALRHVAQKPCIQIFQTGESLPFDIQNSRSIEMDYPNLTSCLAAREKISEFIDAIKENPDDVHSPVTHTLEIRAVRGGSAPESDTMARILEELETIRSEIRSQTKPMSMLDLVSNAPLSSLARALRSPPIDLGNLVGSDPVLTAVSGSDTHPNLDQLLKMDVSPLPDKPKK